MNIVNHAMETVGARTKARVQILKFIQSFAPEERIMILAEAILETETLCGDSIFDPNTPAEEPVAAPAPRRAPKKAERPPKPVTPPEARPSPRSGAGKKATRTKSSDFPSKVLPGRTTREAADEVAAVVRKNPGIGANRIAELLGTKRAPLTRTIQFARKLGLIRKEGDKSTTTYHPNGASSGTN